MINPGSFVLCTAQITAALTGQAFSSIDNLEGMTGISLEARFQYGSGGTTAIAKVQTSLDGSLWRDIARFDFATAPATKIANLNGLTPKGIFAYADLGAEGVLDGFMGKALRVVLTTTGTYVDTVLSIRAATR
jgi:hypothetical protein